MVRLFGCIAFFKASNKISAEYFCFFFRNTNNARECTRWMMTGDDLRSRGSWTTQTQLSVEQCDRRAVRHSDLYSETTNVAHLIAPHKAMFH